MSTTQTSWDAHNNLVDRLVDNEKDIAFREAQQQRMLVDLLNEQTPLSHLDENDRFRWLCHEVGAALHIHPNTAGDRIMIAHRLVTELPGTLKMMEAGELTMRHARAAVDAVAGLTAEQIALIEDDFLSEATGLSVLEFAKQVEKAVHRIAPKTMEDRRQEEIDERGVWATSTRNGTVTIKARGLQPVDAAVIMNNLNARAADERDTPSENEALRDTPKPNADQRSADQRSAGQRSADQRSADQRRADALVDLARGEPVAASKPPVGINVCVALSTLIGLDDQPAEIEGPGFVPGSPITAAQARLLAFDADSTWRRLVTDPLGKLVDFGRTKYRPPAALADFVTARDRTCRGLHCNRSAARCDLDHHHAWEHGGSTVEYNLGPVCRCTHVSKHAAGFRIIRRPNGDHEWTTPSGRTFVKRASRYPIDRTAQPARPNTNG